jgi:hypothetical protein
VAVIAVVGCGSSSSFTSTGPPRAAKSNEVTASCASVSYTGSSTDAVECTLPTSGDSIALSSLLGSAQQLNPKIGNSTNMMITAYGATGGSGGEGAGGQHGYGARGGEAETTTNISSFESAYGDTLYYYVGSEGYSDYTNGGRGGTSTIVSDADLTSASPSIDGYSSQTSTNVVLVAGGGGGGGIAEDSAAGDGGQGGLATGGTTSAGGSPGQDGGDFGGHGGAGGNKGNGGGGGDGGAGAGSHAGGSGADGIGGQGGPTHTGSGPSPSTGWVNFSGGQVGGLGAGGEGEWRQHNYNGPGAGGGGGYGGGGGGGGGGDLDGGGGGGGGGSFAVGSTVYVASPPSISVPQGSGGVIVTFMP